MLGLIIIKNVAKSTREQRPDFSSRKAFVQNHCDENEGTNAEHTVFAVLLLLGEYFQGL